MDGQGDGQPLEGRTVQENRQQLGGGDRQAADQQRPHAPGNQGADQVVGDAVAEGAGRQQGQGHRDAEIAGVAHHRAELQSAIGQGPPQRRQAEQQQEAAAIDQPRRGAGDQQISPQAGSQQQPHQGDRNAPGHQRGSQPGG